MALYKCNVTAVSITCIGETCVQCAYQQPALLSEGYGSLVVALREINVFTGVETMQPERVIKLTDQVDDSQSFVVFDHLLPDTVYQIDFRLQTSAGSTPLCSSNIFLHTLPSLQVHRLCHLGEDFAELNWVRPRERYRDHPNLPKECLFQPINLFCGFELLCVKKSFDGSKVPTLGGKEEVIAHVRHRIDDTVPSPCSYLFEHLEAFTVYFVKLRGYCNETGFGQFATQQPFFVTLSPDKISAEATNNREIVLTKCRATPQLPKFTTEGPLRQLQSYESSHDGVEKYELKVYADWKNNQFAFDQATLELNQITHALEMTNLNAVLSKLNGNVTTECEIDLRAAAKRKMEISTILAFQEKRKQTLTEELKREYIHDQVMTLPTRWETWKIGKLRLNTKYTVKVTAFRRTVEEQLMSTVVEVKAANDEEAQDSESKPVDTNHLSELLSVNLSKHVMIDSVTESAAFISWSPIDVEEVAHLAQRFSLATKESEKLEIKKALQPLAGMQKAADELRARRMKFEYAILIAPINSEVTLDDWKAESEMDFEGSLSLSSSASFSRRSTSQTKSGMFAARIRRAVKRLGGVLTAFLAGSGLCVNGDPGPQVVGAESFRIRTHLHAAKIDGLNPNQHYRMQMWMYSCLDEDWFPASRSAIFCTADLPQILIKQFPKSRTVQQQVVCAVVQGKLADAEERYLAEHPSEYALPRFNQVHSKNSKIEMRITEVFLEGQDGKHTRGSNLVAARILTLKEAYRSSMFKNLAPNRLYVIQARKKVQLPVLDEMAEDSRRIVFETNWTAWSDPLYFGFRCIPVHVLQVGSDFVLLRVVMSEEDYTSKQFMSTKSTLVIFSVADKVEHRDLTGPVTEMKIQAQQEERIVFQSVIARSFGNQRELAMADMQSRWLTAQASISVSQKCSVLPLGIGDTIVQVVPAFSTSCVIEKDLDLSAHAPHIFHDALRRAINQLEQSDDVTLEKTRVEFEIVPFLVDDAFGTGTTADLSKIPTIDEEARLEERHVTREPIVLTSLKPGSYYSLRMRPLMSYSDGPQTYGMWSPKVFFRTLAALNITVRSLSERSVTISWFRQSTFTAPIQPVLKDPQLQTFGVDPADAMIYLHRHALFGKYQVSVYIDDDSKGGPFSDEGIEEVVSQTSWEYNELSTATTYVLKVRQIGMDEVVMGWSENSIRFRTFNELQAKVSSLGEDSYKLTISLPVSATLEPKTVDRDGVPMKTIRDRSLPTQLLQVRLIRSYRPLDYEGREDPLETGEDTADTPIPQLSNSVEGVSYWEKFDVNDVPWFGFTSGIHHTPVHESEVDVSKIVPDFIGVQLINLLPGEKDVMHYQLNRLARGVSYGVQIRRKEGDSRVEMGPWIPKIVFVTRQAPVCWMEDIGEYSAMMQWKTPVESDYLPGNVAPLKYYEVEYVGFFNVAGASRMSRSKDMRLDSGGRMFEGVVRTTQIYNLGTLQYQFAKLLPGAVYYYTIRAVYADGTGPHAAVGGFQTVMPLQISLQNVGQCHAVVQVTRTAADDKHEKAEMQSCMTVLTNNFQRLKVMSRSSTKQLLRGLEAGEESLAKGCIEDLDYEFTAADVRDVTMPLPGIVFSRISDDFPCFLVENLDPGNHYTCAVRSINRKGTNKIRVDVNDWSKSVRISTAEGLTAEVESCSEQRVTLKIVKPSMALLGLRPQILANSRTQHYHVGLYGDDSADKSTFAEIDMTEGEAPITIEICNLRAGCVYLFRSRAIVPLERFNGKPDPDRGSWFSVASFCSAPIPPSVPTLYEAQNGMISIFWNRNRSQSLSLVPGEAYTSSVTNLQKVSGKSEHEIAEECLSKRVEVLLDTNSVQSVDGKKDLSLCCSDDYPHVPFEEGRHEFNVEVAPVQFNGQKGEIHVGTFRQYVSKNPFSRFQCTKSIVQTWGHQAPSHLCFRIKTHVFTPPTLPNVHSSYSVASVFKVQLPLRAPTNLRMVSIGSTTAVIEWSLPVDWDMHNQVCFQVDICRESCGTEWKCAKKVFATNRAVVRPLYVKEKYKIRVASFSSFGKGGTSKSLIFHTASTMCNIDSLEFDEVENVIPLNAGSFQRCPFVCPISLDATPPPAPTCLHRETQNRVISAGVDLHLITDDILLPFKAESLTFPVRTIQEDADEVAANQSSCAAILIPTPPSANIKEN